MASKQLTVHNATINTAAVEVKAQPVRYPLLRDEDWLREQYEVLGRSTTEIAALLGCAQSLAWKALRRNGIEARSCGRSVVHGHTGTPTWLSWAAMRARCLNSKHHKWNLYGGRGIAVCARWTEPDGRGFASFEADMGPRPVGMTLDRIDPNGNYEPGNCRWADALTQRASRRDSVA